MPIYEYECKKCGHHAEVFQKFSDRPVSKCEVCNGKMRKLISHSSFHLKGTGWYVTDYASKSASSAGPVEKTKKSSDSSKKASEVNAKGASEDSTKGAASKTKE